LEELESLAEAAGYAVVGTVEQARRADSRFQVGKGKVKEIVRLVKEQKAERLVFDNELKAVQAYNLARETGVEVLDRFQLILEIFTRRASTVEAKLQIQLARLRYELAHAKERVRLARLEEQPGFMGLGAYEVDVYHDAVQKRVQTIQRKLKRIKSKRGLHRRRRLELGFSTVSLAGYTHAGKSTLFNLLVNEAVSTGNGLFTTLSTTTRAMELSGRQVLLTDTVGFIDRLPITVVEAFRSTLEETIFSDLILLIADASEPTSEIERKLSVCLETLREIGAYGIPIITALNKIDLLSDLEIQQRTEELKEIAPNIVPLSARSCRNIDLLKKQVFRLLKKYVHAAFSVPLSDKTASFLSWLFTHTKVETVKYERDSVCVEFEAVPSFADKVLGRAKQYGGTIVKVPEMGASPSR